MSHIDQCFILIYYNYDKIKCGNNYLYMIIKHAIIFWFYLHFDQCFI